MKKVKLSIGQQSLALNCFKEDEADILSIAKRLSDALEEARTDSGVSDRERAALMAGLQVAFDIKKTYNSPIQSLFLSAEWKKKLEEEEKRIKMTLTRSEPVSRGGKFQ